MDLIIKQRILGSLVLIAIGIVFIPALLSGNATVFHQSLQSNIPDKPAFVIDLSEEQKLNIARDNARMAAQASSGAIATKASDSAATTAFPLSESLPAVTAKPSVTASSADSKASSVATSQSSQLVASKPIATQDMSYGKDAANVASKPAQPSAIATAPRISEDVGKPVASSPVKTSAAASANKALASSNNQQIAKAQTQIVAKPAAKPSIAAVAAPVATSAEEQKGWVVQVASFREHANATAMQKRLARHGMQSIVVKSRSKNGMLYRVRLGPWRQKQAASKQQVALEKLVGLDTLLLHLR